MPYFTKKGTGKNKGKTCVYKKSSKKKVGCTAGPVEKYLTALRMAESEDLEWMMGSPKIRLGEIKGKIYDYVSPGDTVYVTGRMFLEEFTFDELSDSLYNEGKFIDLYEEPATVLEKNKYFHKDRLNVKFGENITSNPYWVDIINDDWIDLGSFQMDYDLLITLPKKSINESNEFDWAEDFEWTTDMLYSMLENCNEIKVSNYNLTTDSPYVMRDGPTIYTLTRCQYWWDRFSQIPLDDNGRGPAEWYDDYDEGRIGLISTYGTKDENIRDIDWEDANNREGWTISQDPREVVRSLNGKHTELLILLDDKGRPIYDLIPKEHRERIKTNWEDHFFGEKLNESEDLDWILDEGKDKTYIIEKLKETFKEYGVDVDWDLEYDRNVNPDGYYEEYFGRFWYEATGGREYFIDLYESSEGFFFRILKLDETDDQYYIDDTYSQQYTLEKEVDKFCLLVTFLVLNQCGKLKSTRSFNKETSVNESELGWIEELKPEFNATMLRYGQKFKNKWGDIIRTIMFIGQDDQEVSYEKPMTGLTFKIVDDPSGYRPYPSHPKDHPLNSELFMNPREFDKGLKSGQYTPMFKDGSFKLKESDEMDWIRDIEADMLIPGEIYDIKTGNGYYWIPEKFIGKEWDNEYNQEVYKFKDLDGSGSGRKSTQYVKDLINKGEIRPYDPNWSVRDEITFTNNIEDALNGSFAIYFKDGVYLDQTKELQDRLFDMGFSFYTKGPNQYITSEDSPKKIQFFECINWDTSNDRYRNMPPDQWDNKKVMLVSVDGDSLSRWNRIGDDKRLEDQKLFLNIVDNNAIVINGDGYVNNDLNESKDFDWVDLQSDRPLHNVTFKVKGYPEIYTIKDDGLRSSVKLTWINDFGEKQTSTYMRDTVNNYFKKGTWEPVEGTITESSELSWIDEVPGDFNVGDKFEYLPSTQHRDPYIVEFVGFKPNTVEGGTRGVYVKVIDLGENTDSTWDLGRRIFIPNKYLKDYLMKPDFMNKLRLKKINESDFDWIQKQEPEKVMKKSKSYGIDVRHLRSEPPISPLSTEYNDLTKTDILDKLRDLGYNVSDIDVDSATYFYVEPQQGTGWEYNEYGVPIDYDYWVDYETTEKDDPTFGGKYEMVDVDEFMFLIDNNLITESDFDWLDMGEPMSICEAQHKLNVGDTIIVDYLEAWADSPDEELVDANNATATVLAIDACNKIQPNNTSTDKTILIHVNEPYTGFDEYWVRDFKPKYQKPCMDGRCMYLICGESDEMDEIKVTKLPSKIFGENKKPINEVAGISFEARKWAEIIYNEIISNPEEKTRLIIDGYDHPEAFDGFPIDYVVVDFYDRLTGYGQEHSGYDKDGNYVVLLYVQPKLVSGQGGYSLQSALNHEMKHAWEDYNRLSKGLPSIEQTKESQELYNRDYILMLSDQNVRGPIKEILKYYYYLSNLEKSAYLENVYDQNPAYERVVRDIASKDFESFKDRFDLDVNWHLMNTAYDIPFLKKFKSPREFIDYSAEELRSRALKMIKKMNKMRYIHGK